MDANILHMPLRHKGNTHIVTNLALIRFFSFLLFSELLGDSSSLSTEPRFIAEFMCGFIATDAGSMISSLDGSKAFMKPRREAT